MILHEIVMGCEPRTFAPSRGKMNAPNEAVELFGQIRMKVDVTTENV